MNKRSTIVPSMNCHQIHFDNKDMHRFDIRKPKSTTCFTTTLVLSEHFAENIKNF